MIETITIICILFVAIVFHEYAHGWVALKMGDPTAKLAGRLTLNPIKHIDPVGTILLPGMLILLKSMGWPVFPIGWAKPVPVNFMRLRNPKRDMIFVGMAGPAINIVIATIASFIMHMAQSELIVALMALTIFINVLLAVFNMLPIPPLDGSRLVMGLLPNKFAYPYSRLEPYGIIIVIVLINFGLFHKLILPIVDSVARLFGI